MRIEDVTESNLADAAYIHAEAWRESHRGICSEAFIAAHTTERQMQYIRGAIDQGRRFFMLTNDVPVAVVSVEGNVIADLYVHPAHQGRGYGTKMIGHAMSLCDGVPALWVLSTNQAALWLYDWLGFVKSGRSKELKNDLFEIEMIYRKG